MSLIDQIIKNPDVSRILVIAAAIEAKRSGEAVSAKDLASAFSYLVRKLERLGPDRYLETSGRLITDASTGRR